MKILVTGSEGFIGRNLVEELEWAKHEVVTFDTKSNRLEEFFEDVNVSELDFIFHLGAISSTLEKDINKLYKHNVEFSIDLFNVAIEYKIPIVYTSSASVFGNTMRGECHYNPLNYYATTKMLTEMWISQNYSRFSSIAIPRLFNVYGKNERKDEMSTSPICKFKNQAENEGMIKVFKGSENMIRDFVCVDNIVDVLIENCMHHHVRGFFDVGTSEPISFLEVAQLCSEKYDVPIRFIDMPDEMKASYQYYTRAEPNPKIRNLWFKSVKDWLHSS